MASGAQIRAARALLNWTQQYLAERSAVAAQTIRLFETGAREPYLQTVEALEACLEQAGILFVETDTAAGVMLKHNASDTRSGG